MPAHNIAMIVAYDGSDFLGWQDNGQGRSVESELRSVLEKILRHPVTLQAASRTDVGVHAEGQVVNFHSNRETVNATSLFSGVNALLPDDIAVRKLWIADHSFHPTLDNVGKEYHYRLCCGDIQMPLARHFQWHYPTSLNLDLMLQAAQIFIGRHDFRAFCNMRKGLHYDSFVRTLQRLDIVFCEESCLRIELEGDAFLYKMARNIVGTLIYVGCGKLQLDEVTSILNSKDRTLAGMTAPAHGLVLKQVFY
ncbi:MAG: tRNA pseudouridine(38-40) synthase TruA [Chlamydiales bacterium]|nr:tRNA pseudouridine(38-40) synthase TruA [Chlamydiales bacterium]